MNANPIRKKVKLGEGAYGVVYEGEIEKQDTTIKVAVKRNFGEEELYKKKLFYNWNNGDIVN